MLEPGLEQASWFPPTKFRAPALGADILMRAELVAQLDRAAATHPLTLLSAPAGAGKTTLLALWAGQRTTASLRVAWLRLDAEDNDPLTFLAALVTALHRLEPSFGSGLSGLLATLPDPGRQLRRLMGVLINDVAEAFDSPLVLVLDDLHAITEAAIQQALDYLLDHLPTSMSVVAATRYDPPLALARLRARGQLAELRLEALRFTADEVRGLLNERLHLNLSESDLHTLERWTEGWAAGVRLLALSLDRFDDPVRRGDFVRHLAQSDRYVFDFLAEEVLNDQRPALRQFLLETSILGELTPLLCEAVTGRRDAARLLDEIDRRNLFISATPVPAETGEHAYSYHHLFAAFLRQQLRRELAADRIHELHRRAGKAVASPARAVHHYLAAEQWVDAAEIVERVGQEQMGHGFVRIPATWFEALPGEVRAQRPWLRLLAATAAVQRGEMDVAQRELEGVLDVFAQAGDRAGEIGALFALMRVELSRNNLERGVQYGEQLLAQPLPSPARVTALVGRMWVSYWQRDWRQISLDLAEVLTLSLSANNPGITRMVALSINTHLMFADVPLTVFEHYCDHVLQRFPAEGGVIEAGTRLQLGAVRALQGRLDEARREVQCARQISAHLGGLAWQDLSMDAILLMDALARADYDAVEQIVTTAYTRMGYDQTYQQWHFLFSYAEARAWWLRDRLDDVRRIHTRLSAHSPPNSPPELTIVRAVVGSWVARGEGRFPAAEAALRQVAPLHQRIRSSILTGQPALELADLYIAWGRPKEALFELRTVLDEMARREMAGLLLAEGRNLLPLLELARKHDLQSSFIQPILAFWSDTREARPVFIPDMGETLTAREVEVLDLLVAGASNQMIASELVITERTARAHVSNILRKLQVSSRLEAAARYRAISLR